MEYNLSIPIYQQVVIAIKRDIITGQRKPGEKLPSVRDLAIAYTINPNTVSRVYKELEQEKMCFTRRGMGTFVTEDLSRVQQARDEMAADLIREFMDGMQKLGFSEEETMKRLSEQNKD